MDTLVLEGKEFISTKRAAEITGYAKDYIGQLCREGRVDSRLIGRNWYILESSIREHRYGPVAQEKREESAVAEVEPEEELYEDPEPIQEMEEAKNEPVEDEVITESAQETVIEEPEEDSEAIENIQRAWQSWFANRYVQETPTPLTLSKDKAAEEDTASPKETSEAREGVNMTDTEADQSQKIQISRIPERVATHVLPERPAHVVSMSRGHRSVPLQEASREVASPREEAVATTHTKAPRRVILQALSIAIAGLSLAAALIGAGALDSVSITNPLQAEAMRFIGGTISF